MASYPAINIQHPISQEIVLGRKTVETRTYPVPPKYLGKEMILVETPGSNGLFAARAVALIRFKRSYKYASKKAFYLDYDRHLVSKESIWAWKDKAKWGWEVELIKVFSKPIKIRKRRGIVFTASLELPT